MNAAVAIPTATAFLYLYAFAFEVGYGSSFGYPPGIVPVSLDLILNLGTALFSYAAACFIFLQLNLQYWPSARAYTIDFLAVLILFFGLLILFKLYLPDHQSLAYILSPAFALLGIRATRTLRRAAANTEHSAVPNVYDKRGEIPADSLASWLIHRLGFDPLLLGAIALLVIPLLFFGAGFADARSKREFLLFEEGGSNFVVLRTGGGMAIAAELVSAAGSYRESFLVRPLTSLGPMEKLTELELRRIDTVSSPSTPSNSD